MLAASLDVAAPDASGDAAVAVSSMQAALLDPASATQATVRSAIASMINDQRVAAGVPTEASDVTILDATPVGDLNLRVDYEVLVYFVTAPSPTQRRTRQLLQVHAR